jgi:hypothetical protein
MCYVRVELLDSVSHWLILMMRFMAEFTSGLDAVGESVMVTFCVVDLIIVILLLYFGMYRRNCFVHTISTDGAVLWMVEMVKL